MEFKPLSQEEIEKIGDKSLIDAFLTAIREIDVIGISRAREAQALHQSELIEREMLKRMSANPWSDAFSFGTGQATTEEERAFLAEAEQIAEQVIAMSDAEVTAYLEEHNLTHLVTAERIEAMLAEASKDPRKAVMLKLVWDRDKEKPSGED
jgi:hypothetical protein